MTTSSQYLDTYLKNQESAYGHDISGTVDSARKALASYNADDWNNFIERKMPNSDIAINKATTPLDTSMADSQQERNKRAFTILNELFDGKKANPSSSPKMLQVLGGAGSAKTFRINEMMKKGETLSGNPIDTDNTVFIDVPDMMHKIAEQKGFTDKQIKTPEFSSMVRHEASLLAKTAVEVALENKLDIIYEGADVPEFKRQSNLAQENGYDVEACVLFTSPQKSLERIAKRFDENGGTLPPVSVALEKTAAVSDKALDVAYHDLNVTTNLYETFDGKTYMEGNIVHVIDRKKSGTPNIKHHIVPHYENFKKIPECISKLNASISFSSASKEETVIGHGKYNADTTTNTATSPDIINNQKQR
jgi:hypothetical protein